MVLQDCTALITGASAGIGREFARQLGGRARTLVLVARRQERLEQLRDELRACHASLNVQLFVADLSKPEMREQLQHFVEEQEIALDLLINNAGVGDQGRFATGDPARSDRMVQVNIAALTDLTHRFLPAMIARQRGAILNVSSCASFIPLPRMAVYAATKAFVTSFSEALHAEVRSAGVSVSALCPGPVETEFNTVARRPNERGQEAPGFVYVSVEEVARVGLEGIEQNRPVAIPGLAMKVAMFFFRLMPMPLLRLALRASA